MDVLLYDPVGLFSYDIVHYVLGVVLELGLGLVFVIDALAMLFNIGLGSIGYVRRFVVLFILFRLLVVLLFVAVVAVILLLFLYKSTMVPS